MKRRENIQKFYSLGGGVNQAEMLSWQNDLFKYGAVLGTAVTTAILVSAATTTAISVTGTAADGILISGVCTDGIHISSACTANAINLSGASAVGVSLSGAFTTAAIDITATAGRGIRIGTKGKAADGSLPITATLPFDTDPANNYLLGVFSKVATTAAAATDDLGSAWLRTRVNAGMGTKSSYSLYGAKSQLRVYADTALATTINNWVAAGILGVLEVSGATTTFASGAVAAAGYFNVALTTTSVIASGAVVAGVVINTHSAAITNTGSAYFGLYIQDYAGGKVDFDAGVKIADSCCTIGVSIGACSSGISFDGAIAAGNCIDFAGTCVTTGSLLDYIGIAGKVSGYLFNGTMITSVLTGSTFIDDFSCACDHDGATADTLRMIRRIWSGNMPNDSAAAAFVLEEFQWTGDYGDGGALGGDPGMILLDCDATINDSGADFRALEINMAGMTLTSAANIYGVDITGKTGVDAGVHITTATAGISFAGTITNIFDITAAATTTYFAKFNAASGCVIETDVECADEPSNLGLGADGCIAIDVAGDVCYIPYFSILAS